MKKHEKHEYERNVSYTIKNGHIIFGALLLTNSRFVLPHPQTTRANVDVFGWFSQPPFHLCLFYDTSSTIPKNPSPNSSSTRREWESDFNKSPLDTVISGRERRQERDLCLSFPWTEILSVVHKAEYSPYMTLNSTTRLKAICVSVSSESCSLYSAQCSYDILSARRHNGVGTSDGYCFVCAPHLYYNDVTFLLLCVSSLTRT